MHSRERLMFARSRTSRKLIGAVALSFVLGSSALLPPAARAQSTAFTYQGALDDAGVPTNGLHDIVFRLYDAVAGGAQIGLTQCVDDVEVVDGVFTAQIDFGQQFATTAERYLEIELRRDTGLTCGDGTGMVVLAPRQLLTAAPMATHAKSAFALDAADGSPANAVFVDNAGKVGHWNHDAGHAGSCPRQRARHGPSGPSERVESGRVHRVLEQRCPRRRAGCRLRLQTGNPDFSVVNVLHGGRHQPTSRGETSVSERRLLRAKLDVRGDIKLGPSGQLPRNERRRETAHRARQSLRPNGTPVVGSGFTSSRTSTGVYVITFTTSFPSTPVLTVSGSVGATGGPFIAQTNGVTTISAGVRITNGSGTSVDDSFDFIAIGPR